MDWVIHAHFWIKESSSLYSHRVVWDRMSSSISSRDFDSSHLPGVSLHHYRIELIRQNLRDWWQKKFHFHYGTLCLVLCVFGSWFIPWWQVCCFLFQVFVVVERQEIKKWWCVNSSLIEAYFEVQVSITALGEQFDFYWIVYMNLLNSVHLQSFPPRTR